MHVGIHFQFMKDSEPAKRLFELDKPFSAFIVPDLLNKELKTPSGKDICGRIHTEDNYYPQWAIDLFREHSGNKNVTWIQEGYRHCCDRCFGKFEENGGREKGGWPDPFHEHVCLDGHVQRDLEQHGVIWDGKDLLESFGISPTGYCPPNHLYNDDTLRAAGALDFKYFITRNGFDYFFGNMIGIQAYREDGLIIVPESKREDTKSPLVLTYYDSLERGGNLSELLNSSVPLSELYIKNEVPHRAGLNHELINLAKKLRDMKAKS